eukprot:scaffold117564_cov45-Prasinocladus_malaysianus.AAC.5
MAEMLLKVCFTRLKTERLHLMAPATGGWLRVRGGECFWPSNISRARSISRLNCSRMSTNLLIICCWIAPLDWIFLKLRNSSKAPSALRSLRKLVSISSRVVTCRGRNKPQASDDQARTNDMTLRSTK